MVLWDPEEAPTLYFKGSKPGAVPPGWSLFRARGQGDAFERFDTWRAISACGLASIGLPWSSSRQAPRAPTTCPPFCISGMQKGGRVEVDRSIAELAGKQHGVVCRRQLLAFAGPGAIAARVRRGALHPIHRGVYAVGHDVIGVRGRWKAATLAVGSEAVLSHRSASHLWGLLPRMAIVPEVTVPHGWRGRAGICIRRSAVPLDEADRLDGIPVTTVPRTVLDLAAVVPKRRLERALNEVEVQGLTDRLSIPDLLERYPRRRGSAVLRSLLGEGAAARGVTRNDFEERFAALVDSHDLPRPRFNADLAIGGRFFEVDCLWANERLIVELDGGAVHGTARAFESDRERDRLLLVEGWRVMRVTWRQLCDQGAAIASDVRKALQSG